MHFAKLQKSFLKPWRREYLVTWNIGLYFKFPYDFKLKYKFLNSKHLGGGVVKIHFYTFKSVCFNICPPPFYVPENYMFSRSS